VVRFGNTKVLNLFLMQQKQGA